MASSFDPNTSPETNVDGQGASCAKGCAFHRSGLLRAALYSPIFVVLGGLAAMATYPELANYATPLIGESTPKYQCPIAAMMAAVSGEGATCCSSSSSSAASCCGSAQPAAGGCCGSGIMRCGITVEETSAESAENQGGDLTKNDASSESEEAPADAIAAANVNLND